MNISDIFLHAKKVCSLNFFENNGVFILNLDFFLETSYYHGLLNV